LHSLTGSHSKHSTQCSHHSQKFGHIFNKKHSQSHSNVVQDSNTQQWSVIHKSASQSQYSQAILSQPGPELSLKERLLWLQKRRDVGLWVQCCRPTCNKWRYLHDIRDPVNVPQEWFCHMNSGTFVQYMSLFEVWRFIVWIVCYHSFVHVNSKKYCHSTLQVCPHIHT
jgi:hypothetical protein